MNNRQWSGVILLDYLLIYSRAVDPIVCCETNDGRLVLEHVHTAPVTLRRSRNSAAMSIACVPKLACSKGRFSAVVVCNYRRARLRRTLCLGSFAIKMSIRSPLPALHLNAAGCEQ